MKFVNGIIIDGTRPRSWVALRAECKKCSYIIADTDTDERYMIDYSELRKLKPIGYYRKFIGVVDTFDLRLSDTISRVREVVGVAPEKVNSMPFDCPVMSDNALFLNFPLIADNCLGVIPDLLTRTALYPCTITSYIRVFDKDCFYVGYANTVLEYSGNGLGSVLAKRKLLCGT